jgi:hypothetical protein
MSLLSSLETRLQGSIFLSAVVDATEQVAPSMRAIWLSSVAIADMVYLPGQHVRVQTGALLGMDLVRGDTLRTYSVWRLERAAGRMALCVFDHPGQGPGARWAKTVQVGDVVRFRPPEGKLVTSRHTRARSALFASTRESGAAARAARETPGVLGRNGEAPSDRSLGASVYRPSPLVGDERKMAPLATPLANLLRGSSRDRFADSQRPRKPFALRIQQVARDSLGHVRRFAASRDDCGGQA